MNFATLSAADESPGKGDVAPSLAGENKLFNLARAVYTLPKGSYVGGLVTDTEFGRGYNRVVAGDLSLHLGEHHLWSGTVVGTRSRDPGNLSRLSGIGGQVTCGYNSKKYTSFVQLEHYDTGLQMDTAFFRRTGFTGGNAYFAPSFYSDQKRHPWFKRFTPFVFAQGERDCPQRGDEALAIAAAGTAKPGPRVRPTF